MSGFKITKPEKLKRYIRPAWEGNDVNARCVGLLHSDYLERWEPVPRDAWEPVDDHEPVLDPRRPEEQDIPPSWIAFFVVLAVLLLWWAFPWR